MRARYALLAVLLVPALAAAQARDSRRPPTIDDLLKVTSVGGARLSPDGNRVAYSVTETDFTADAFISHLWIADVATRRTFQLTRGDKSEGNAQWSPDGAWLSFTSDRVGGRNQVFVISPNGGEAVQLTKAENGVNGYAWSRDGRRIAYTSSDADAKATKDRRDNLGDFEIVRREYNHSHLWTVEVAEAMKAPAAGTQHTKGKTFSIGGFDWSPDGTRIAFSATMNPDLINGGTADVFVLTLADNAVRPVVTQAGPDNGPRWSPDGRQLAFSSAMGNPKYFHANSRIAVVAAEGGTPRSITDGFDESPGLIEWRTEGVYFGGSQKTSSHLFRVDPATAQVTRVTSPDGLMAGGFSFSRDGKQIAFTAPSPTELTELYVTDLQNPAGFAPRKLTASTDQVKDFLLATREVVSWKSKDGATIEGILIKPADFDPSVKRPLMCVIHGGPTGVDRPTLLDARYYPADIWAARGALVLKVNYRGSAGYGEKFRQLNVRNLGVGDAWDVLSGVDMLIAKGWVDPAKVGCMGWSQGGYISAFLTTSTTRFAAISVGAGISNWATYYYNTDITPFTIQYLNDDPADDPAIYAKTSPMTYVKGAKTPTLIQHGEFDRRVPIANAYELRQGLEDRGVPVEMVVYKGFGHGITKPRSMRAVMQHNLAWFNHYLFGDPLVDLGRPAVP